MDRRFPHVYTGGGKVTKSDTDSSGNVWAGLYIGTLGNVAVVLRDSATGTVTTFTNLNSGTLLPIATKYVMSTGTTASDVIGLR